MEILFCKREVYISEKSNETNEETKVGGQLQLIKNVKKKKIYNDLNQVV
jgi:hypothetical protein